MRTYDDIMQEAHRAGEFHGLSAASWFFCDTTDREEYARLLSGLEDGDPEILDSLPSSPLSGEWADDPTPATVFADLALTGDEDYADDVLSTY